MKIITDLSPPNKYWNPSEILPAEFNGLCFHVTSGYGTREYLKTTNRDVSTNYLIERDGTIVQMVPTGSICWAANPRKEHRKFIPEFFNPNRHRSFNQVLQSIEVELKENEKISDKQFEALVFTCRTIHDTYEIPIEQHRYFRHSDLDKNRRDPGKSYEPMDVLNALQSQNISEQNDAKIRLIMQEIEGVLRKHL